MTKKELPDPNVTGTAPDVLKNRFNTGNPFDVPVGNAPPTSAQTPPADRGRAGKGTRPDPVGMKRISLYVTEESAAALDQAADQLVTVLGGDVPKHVAYSALLTAGAQQAPGIAQDLIARRAAELAARLQALQAQQPE